MLKIGLSGGIGSGKTAVSNAFSDLGITIVDADIVARDIVRPNSPCLKAIKEHFGNGILQDDGGLNRAMLRDIIFNCPSEKQWLEALMHPHIRDAMIQQLNQAQSPYVILSSPLLLETQQDALVDRIVIVDAPEALQITRASQRDKVDKQQIQTIMQNQYSRHERLKKADDIIDNSSTLDATREQVTQLHLNYLQLVRQ